MEKEQKKFKVTKSRIIFILLLFVFGICCYFNVEHNNENTKILGEAEYVNVNTEVKDDAFVDSRMEIERARDIEISHLKDLLNDENMDERTKNSATQAYLEIAKCIETEKICEEQIKNKIKCDVMVVISPPEINVTVDSDTLNVTDIARIKEILLSKTDITAEGIKISLID